MRNTGCTVKIQAGYRFCGGYFVEQSGRCIDTQETSDDERKQSTEYES